MVSHFVLAWLALLHDPRIATAIIVIGCPDYVRLMTDRAAKSKLPSWTDGQGREFLGSKDFPRSLVEAVERYDPAGLLMGELDTVTGDDYIHPPSEAEITRLRPLMREHLGGKRILCLSGGKDKLVPYACGDPFLHFLKSAIDEKKGWFNDRGTRLEDVVDKEAGHEYSAKMSHVAVKWISDLLAEDSQEGALGTGKSAGSRTSKM
ncbi:hypothetical protein LTR66_008676 [Elasticomyces elasticus]|nr:hypothetical protein LTR66_008676 [Elasticomyces elasticus]